jgi:hypothetical protein
MGAHGNLIQLALCKYALHFRARADRVNLGGVKEDVR